MLLFKGVIPMEEDNITSVAISWICSDVGQETLNQLDEEDEVRTTLFNAHPIPKHLPYPIPDTTIQGRGTEQTKNLLRTCSGEKSLSPASRKTLCFVSVNQADPLAPSTSFTLCLYVLYVFVFGQNKGHVKGITLYSISCHLH